MANLSHCKIRRVQMREAGSNEFPEIPLSDAAIDLDQPADQLFRARVLAPRHNPRQEGVPHVTPDYAQRLPPEEVQELEWLAEVVGRVHQLLPLFLQNLSG